MPEHVRSKPDEHLLQRVRGEFLEMPGLRLSRQQAQRLLGLDDATCTNVLNALIEIKFLSRGPDGSYSRLSEERLPAKAQRMAKADVQPDDETTQLRKHRVTQ